MEQFGVRFKTPEPFRFNAIASVRQRITWPVPMVREASVRKVMRILLLFEEPLSEVVKSRCIVETPP